MMSGANGAGEGRGDAVRRGGGPPRPPGGRAGRGGQARPSLRGARPYTNDLRTPGALYAVLVPPGFAQARIKGVDTGAAAAAPGVVGVYRGGAQKPAPYGPAGPPVDTPKEMVR